MFKFKRRPTVEINSSSMADIAFLLLIFFLVTTTISMDQGINLVLPSEGNEVKINVYPHQIAFNCLPHIDNFLDNGYTKEEMKMINETRKILGDDSVQVCPTTVRVPVFYSHSEALNIETEGPITGSAVKELLKAQSGISVVDDPPNNEYPLAIEGEDKNEVFVGRIRDDISCERAVNLWVVSDNLRKGAALNAVQIAELLIARR